MPRRMILILIAVLGLAVGCGNDPSRPAPQPQPAPKKAPAVNEPSPITRQDDHQLPGDKTLRKKTEKRELCKHQHNFPSSALVYRVSRWK